MTQYKENAKTLKNYIEEAKASGKIGFSFDLEMRFTSRTMSDNYAVFGSIFGTYFINRKVGDTATGYGYHKESWAFGSALGEIFKDDCFFKLKGVSTDRIVERLQKIGFNAYIITRSKSRRDPRTTLVISFNDETIAKIESQRLAQDLEKITQGAKPGSVIRL